MKLKNIAIIAHVDHGKTTLVDQLLKKSDTFRDNEVVSERAMDSNDLERERGITILAKTTAINYQDYKINILDTPGHADFGGEVERIMNMVDGVCLVVDAYEGPMPQTRFVLSKALAAGVKPIVLINKVDKPTARVKHVVDEVLELFMDLGATDDQLDFKVAYVSAINGTCSLDENVETQNEDYNPLFDMIVSEVPSPKESTKDYLQFQPALLDYNDFLGRIAIGKVTSGEIKVNSMVTCMRLDGTKKEFRVQKLFGFHGLKRIEIESASSGEIIALAGLADISVGETICNPGKEDALPVLRIDEPTLKMTFSTSNSPFIGKDGKIVTASKIEERLFKATQSDVSLIVEKISNDSWAVSGRGELHLSILIENMRREGFELMVAKPEVIIKEIDGEKCEPYEDVQIEVDDEAMGSVIEALGNRGASLESINKINDLNRLIYLMPSRGLIGFNTEFMTLTKGYGIINHTFKKYMKVADNVSSERKLGVLVSMENGKATAYAAGALEDRGILFIEPGADVYEGMIIGECNKENDLAVNIVKAKQLTNTRAASADKTVVLKRPRPISLEYALEFINSDELVEITPNNIRITKKVRNTDERKKIDSRKAKGYI